MARQRSRRRSGNGRSHPVSDIMMPKLDGFGLLAAVRADSGLAQA